MVRTDGGGLIGSGRFVLGMCRFMCLVQEQVGLCVCLLCSCVYCVCFENSCITFVLCLCVLVYSFVIFHFLRCMLMSYAICRECRGFRNFQDVSNSQVKWVKLACGTNASP